MQTIKNNPVSFVLYWFFLFPSRHCRIEPNRPANLSFSRRSFSPPSVQRYATTRIQVFHRFSQRTRILRVNLIYFTAFTHRFRTFSCHSKRTYHIVHMDHVVVLFTVRQCDMLPFSAASRIRFRTFGRWSLGPQVSESVNVTVQSSLVSTKEIFENKGHSRKVRT